MLPILLVSLLVPACSGQTAPDASTEQYAFARAWISIYETEQQSEAEARLRTLRERWIGKRFAWQVELIAPFCRDGACNVRAFDYARLPASATIALGGAMPRVELRPASFGALVQRASRPGRCVATIDATIASLPEDTESPLMMRLSDGQHRSLRAPRPGERFERIVRPRLAAREWISSQGTAP